MLEFQWSCSWRQSGNFLATEIMSRKSVWSFGSREWPCICAHVAPLLVKLFNINAFARQKSRAEKSDKLLSFRPLSRDNGSKTYLAVWCKSGWARDALSVWHPLKGLRQLECVAKLLVRSSFDVYNKLAAQGVLSLPVVNCLFRSSAPLAESNDDEES